MKNFFSLACAILTLTVSTSAFALWNDDKIILQDELEKLSSSSNDVYIPNGPTLHPGDSGPDIMSLRQALEGLGYAEEYSGLSDYFDESLAISVKKFQSESGIAADGVVGAQTRNAINGFTRNRISRLNQSLSVDPWPEYGKHIVVNIASGHTFALENGEVVLWSKSVAGKSSRKTPIMNQMISSVTLNPSWTVPPGIAAADFGGRVFTMKPGPQNPLGKFRLDMPNRHHVFLHGTNHPELFGREIRNYSSGCIRVEGIKDFAHWLIGDDVWNSKNLDNVSNSWSTRQIRLENPVPVYLEYRTATVNDAGRVVYHPDPYGLLGR